MTEEQVDALVIGAGPAGLAAARALALGGVGNVLVIDREQQAGGIPLHGHHGGVGLRDLRRSTSGPHYAEAIVRRALGAGVRIETETMATAWSAHGAIELSSPDGVRTVSATAVLLATGARERSRSARLVPGDRPEGVFTTGQLQQWSQLHQLPVGHRAIVVGAEHVSYSAVLTLRAAGVQTIGMATRAARHQTFAGFAAASRWGLRVPLWTETEITALRGRDRLREVDLYDHSTGRHWTVAVDTIVFTGGWMPDNELARSAGLALDTGSKGPIVDVAGECTVDGIYATGNLVHPAETADVAAQRSAAVGASLARRLMSKRPSARQPGVDIVVDAPLQWAAPARIVATGTGDAVNLPHGLILRTTEFRRRPTVVIEQGERRLARFRLHHAVPNRSLHVPLGWAAAVEPGGSQIRARMD